MNSKNKTKEMVNIALMAVVIMVCSWISIPTAVPFTMQTFAIAASVIILGGKNGTKAFLVYLLLGILGLPVFANYQSGFGVLLNTTGGYIIGFGIICLCYWLTTTVFGEKSYIKIISLIVGLMFCYTFGTIWFINVYTKSKGAITALTALGWCVFPFIIPDIIKISLAYIVGETVKKYIK